MSFQGSEVVQKCLLLLTLLKTQHSNLLPTACYIFGVGIVTSVMLWDCYDSSYSLHLEFQLLSHTFLVVNTIE